MERRGSLATPQAEALGANDAAQPAGERGRLAKLRELAVRGQEGLLRRVLRQVGIAHQGVRVAIGEILESPDELAEGVLSERQRIVARLGLSDEGFRRFHVDPKASLARWC